MYDATCHTTFTIVNCKDRFADSHIMIHASDNFFAHKKPYHVHVSWCVSGRKLPTACTSQQLLRWLWPKRYIFSIFWRLKNSKKLLAQTPRAIVRWQLETINLQMLHVRKSCNFWTPQTRVWSVTHVVPADMFWQQDSGHVRICSQNSKSWDFCEILKNPKICKNLQNLQNPQNREKLRKVAILVVCVGYMPNHKKSKKIENFRIFAKSRKIEKIEKNRNFWQSGQSETWRPECQLSCPDGSSDPEKNRQKCAVCRRIDASRKTAEITFRRAKKCTFSAIF